MKNFKKTKNRINIYLMNFTKDNIKKSFVNIILKKKQLCFKLKTQNIDLNSDVF